MGKYNCIIIDDDEVARLKVVSIARKFAVLNIVGYFSSAVSALPFIEREKIDILFLDIDMPKINGLDFRKQLMSVPVCVFITSHPEHAVESFELDTLDFIIKPLSLERFTQTVTRIEEFMEIKRKATLFETSFGDDTIYIKEGYEQTKVKLYDILYIEALKDFTILVTQNKRHCVSNGIGNLLKESNFKTFVRVHRSYAVQKNYIQKIGNQFITLNNEQKIPIGNSYKSNLEALV